MARGYLQGASALIRLFQLASPVSGRALGLTFPDGAGESVDYILGSLGATSDKWPTRFDPQKRRFIALKAGFDRVM